MALALGLPTLANYHGLQNQFGGADRHHGRPRAAADRAGRGLPAGALAGVDLRAVPGDHAAAAVQPGDQWHRPRHAADQGGRRRRRADRRAGGADTGHGVQREHRVRGLGGALLASGQRPGGAGRVPADVVAVAADGGGARRPGQPGGRGVRGGDVDAAAQLGHRPGAVGASAPGGLREHPAGGLRGRAVSWWSCCSPAEYRPVSFVCGGCRSSRRKK